MLYGTVCTVISLPVANKLLKWTAKQSNQHRMTRKDPLPLSEEWTDPDVYVDSLLNFATSSILFRNLCGGVHILDFLTREPDLYTSLLPEDWRNFFDQHDMHDILYLFLREDIRSIGHADQAPPTENGRGQDDENKWKGGLLPPQSLLDYIHDIRRLSLRREFNAPAHYPKEPTIPRRLAVGMKTKKRHEVEYFSRYVDSLTARVSEQRGEDVSHIVDFGSGQNYLGRTLASSPYNKHIIAIERKHEYISGARGMDVSAKLVKKEKVIRKRESIPQRKRPKSSVNPPGEEMQESCDACIDAPKATADIVNENGNEYENGEFTVVNVFRGIDLEPNELAGPQTRNQEKPVAADEEETSLKGAIDYIEHDIQDGYLEPIIKSVIAPDNVEVRPDSQRSFAAAITTCNKKTIDARVMVVSLHSCGNLVHHGVRSLVLNPSVVAVAMIGCCYNLMTERLGPATYKLPVLRSLHPRLAETGKAYDPHGFPMSRRLETFSHGSGTGMKLNITARMMAVQAPYNWGKEDSEGFFTRHFYRALLQRILLDREVVPKPTIPASPYDADLDSSGGTALIVGSLRKSAFTSFSAYVHAALAKLIRHPQYGEKIKERMADISEEEISRYETEYWPAKKNLSVTWSLMAFSAGVVEAIIVVDRWQFLREHSSIKDCWVEPVFEYSESPRNLVVVGVKE